MTKKRVFFTTIACLVLLTIFSLFTLGNYFNQKATLQIQYDTQVIKVEKFDYTSLLELFDEVNVETNETTNEKLVHTEFRLSGTSLDDVVFTSNKEDENIQVSGTTNINQEDNTSQVELALDYGDAIDKIFANSNAHFDENGNLVGTVIFDGEEYDINEVLSATYGENGVQECWFWLIIKIVVVIVNVVVAAITAVDIYKYLTTEEVTLEGILCIVGEGMVMAAVSAIGGAVAGSLIKSGIKAIKNSKKISKDLSVLLGRNVTTFNKECVKLVNQGKTHVKYYYNNTSKLREAYKSRKEFKSFNFTNSNRDDYVEIHHFVEQRQAGNVFANQSIHTDLNSVGVSKVLHAKISHLYSSTTKYTQDISNIFGKNFFDGTVTFRNFVGSKSYAEQYQIGVKVFEYFYNQGKNFALRL